MLTPNAAHQAANGTAAHNSGESVGAEILSAAQFRRMLAIEQRRSERSRRRFVLMLLEATGLFNGGPAGEILGKVWQALARSTRDTDVKGWHKEESVIGVIFTELGGAESHSVASALLMKVTQALAGTLGIEQIHKISLSFHVFPDETTAAPAGNGSGSGASPLEEAPRGFAKTVKRAIDIAGSAVLILLSSPVLLAVALAVKLTSRGPVLFRQTRIGRYGIPFTFLKFRSMYQGNDPAIHQQFVTRFIKGELDSTTAEYKLTADPRVTPVGRFLRKSSLDELPQLFNVLRGHMSLVGPRPPVPYEFESYQTWHRRRLVDAKPGITGLWQVAGRSRVGFDDMVRLDLRYARAWSLWLDLKILFETPRAVVSGNGAH
jgi:lipopolysaccharide/colanic/teichoic acid biosynthesis glycosyltransferase